ncbi:hypothetical protein SAMN05661096_00472 [Marivirga sericea]|uniref:Lipocalin-like domain-containing protein n=1 Tax=Marivirga sericea TaxID=1028 RepID=A0A1X7IDC8_9BACT|nr:hypothetical protein [Marivirga sericea]SMG12146.1 hypothetical protein SAMN05661096_00472 [Marivirga sericea]
MKKLLLSCFLILALFSCLPDEPTFEAFSRSEVQRLLSNRDSKRWILTERTSLDQDLTLEECEVQRQIIFDFTSSATDRDLLFYVNPADTCGNAADTLTGFWFVPSTITPQTPIDTVVFVWEDIDTAYFQLDVLNPEMFTISPFFAKDSLEESFTHFPFPPVVEDDEEEEEDSE